MNSRDLQDSAQSHASATEVADDLALPGSDEIDQKYATHTGRSEAVVNTRSERQDFESSAVDSGWPRTEAAIHIWRERVVASTLQRLFRYRFLCIALAVCAGASGGVATLFMQPFYVAHASIFPPAASNPLGSFGIPGMIGLVGNLNLGGDGASLFPLYERFLFSRTLILDLVKMDLHDAGFPGTLLEYLKIEEPDPVIRDEIAIGALRGSLSFEADNKSVVVTVGYRDADPKVAAAVANRAIQLLDHVNVTTTANRASERRRFIEARLETASTDLARAEKDFEEFEMHNVRINNAPELLMDRARLQREVEIEQQVYLTLRKEYELVLIEEQRTVAVVNVLDHATPPLFPSGPSLVKNAAVAGFLGAILVVTFIVMQTMGVGRLLTTFVSVRARQ